MYVTDMLVTLDKVTANNGKAQLVLSIDSTASTSCRASSA